MKFLLLIFSSTIILSQTTTKNSNTHYFSLNPVKIGSIYGDIYFHNDGSNTPKLGNTNLFDNSFSVRNRWNRYSHDNKTTQYLWGTYLRDKKSKKLYDFTPIVDDILGENKVKEKRIMGVK